MNKSKSHVKPLFQSSFIQYWYAQNWNQERWLEELTMLKEIGIEEVILQSVADTKERFAVYPTKINAFTHNDVDMLYQSLTAANKLGMKIRIGLGSSSDWWTKVYSLEWLNSEAELNKLIVNEIMDKYKSFKSFTGWYIPYEFFQFSAITRNQEKNLNTFLKKITSEIKSRFPKDIMIAPFYQGWLRWLMPLKCWSSFLEKILEDSGIDILALQDSVGTGYNSIKRIPVLFYYTKKALDKLKIKFIADIETFAATSSGNIPADQNRIEIQLNAVKEYVQDFAAFSISHYQNKNDPDQLQYYSDYYRYYCSIK